MALAIPQMHAHEHTDEQLMPVSYTHLTLPTKA